MDNKQHLNSLKFKINYHYILILVICLSAYSCEDVSWFGEEVSTENQVEKVEDETQSTKKKIDNPAEIPNTECETPSINQLLNASVKIIMEKNNRIVGSGSGVFISSNLIATNEHVIKGCLNEDVKIKVQCHDGKEYYAELKKVSVDNDVAIIKTQESKSGFIPNIQVKYPNILDEIIVIGSPQGDKNLASKGNISKIANTESYLDISLLQMTAPISEGSSGGPVFNKCGEIVGVTVAFREGAQNMNYAVPAKYIQRLLE